MDPNDEKLDQKVQDALDPNAGVKGDASARLVRDPVCGTMVDMDTAPDTVTTSDGRTLYFDSAACKALYEANPDQYPTA